MVQGGLIIGFDSDPPDIFQRQVLFIQSTGIVTAMVGMLQAMPGTKLYDRMEKAGRFSGGASGDNVALSTNILPVMGLERLKDGYSEIMKRIYEPPLIGFGVILWHVFSQNDGNLSTFIDR